MSSPLPLLCPKCRISPLRAVGCLYDDCPVPRMLYPSPPRSDDGSDLERAIRAVDFSVDEGPSVDESG